MSCRLRLGRYQGTWKGQPVAIKSVQELKNVEEALKEAEIMASALTGDAYHRSVVSARV